ncbi:hypothetical protein QBC38DRAFT_167377 [Podospora fimiseda]|uniref:Uncharacterized protein n=1 Tax=Podospora fimiseda TaxID=252190 RepID=A0AAN7BEU7_9PEZI|nr:hypothetical protein QBC38DRAFT_167377 [Podospora fimiseda]
MAAVSQLLSSIDRPDSRVSMARSDTTYHSFQDLEVPEPEATPESLTLNKTTHPKATTVSLPPTIPMAKTELPISREMRRQDSGYESIVPRKESPPPHDRRTSSTSLASSATRPKRARPTIQRSSRSRNGRRSMSPSRAYQPRPSLSQEPETYFHFPQPRFTEENELGINEHNPRDFASSQTYSSKAEDASYPLPPQTTHYWTSDQTRRQEYAAIDAASKGVRGWVMRHVVPECFVPPSKRHIGFEDDKGSVIRYRLSLDGDDDGSAEKANNNSSDTTRKGWRFWFLSVRRR